MSHDLSHLFKDTKVPTHTGAQSGSIAERMARASTNAQERLIIIQDCSTSMMEHLSDGHAKMDSAKAAIDAFLSACDRRISAVGLVGFDSTVHQPVPPMQHYAVLREALMGMQPSGGTVMAPALSAALALNPTRLILVSDGCAGDLPHPLTQAKLAAERKIPIDCIYIGPDHDAGAKLMREIAELTGGHFFTVSDMTSYVKTLSKLEYRSRLQLTHQK